MSLNSSKLSLNLAIALASAGIIYTLGLLLALLFIQMPQAVEQLEDDLDQIADSLTSPATQAVFDLDKDYANNILVGLGKFPYITHATIISDDKKILSSVTLREEAHTENQVFLRLLNLPHTKTYKRKLSNERFLPNSYGMLIFEVDIETSLDPLFTRMNYIAKQGLLGTLLLMSIVYGIVHILITRRLSNITRQLQKVSPHSPKGILIQGYGKDDEIETLTKGINRFITSSEHFFSEKERAEKELLDLTQDLENKVAERTQDLIKEKEKVEFALEEANNANRAKSVFLSNMSHELRTPLNSVIGFTRRVLDKEAEQLSSRSQEGLERVLNNGQYLLNLINELLDIAKIEAEKVELDLTTFDLSLLVSTCCHNVEATVEQHGLKLINHLQEPLLIEADQKKMQQVFLNLISNSIKYTERGHVEISLVKRSEHSVSIAVRDTGIGIAEEDFPKLFDPYNHVHSNLNKEVMIQSTGLGLPLSFRLVELHHGRISVESEIGKGSTFTVRLPTRQDR